MWGIFGKFRANIQRFPPLETGLEGLKNRPLEVLRGGILPNLSLFP